MAQYLLRYQGAWPAANEAQRVQGTFSGSPMIVPGRGFIDRVGNERDNAGAKVNAEDQKGQFSSEDKNSHQAEKTGCGDQRAGSGMRAGLT
ncbi:hypothetical protein GCM10008020_25120 [Massilia psychrophila]|nr:hypothetical protein GCM10008020_25120 [Massilia psychrophila]